MLLLTSPEAVTTTILRIAKANNFPLPQTEKQFRKVYQDCLANEQPECFWLRPENSTFLSHLKTPVSQENHQRFLDIYNSETTALDDLDQKSVISSKDHDTAPMVRKLEAAYRYLETSSPIHANFLEALIEQVFIDGSDVAAGGTTSDAVGVIWSNPHPKFSDADLAEFLVHELTHNCMFLDEWLYPHYDYDIMFDENTWALSAILDKKRPIDKVIHSLAVAAEIVLLRDRFFGEPTDPKAHPPSQQICASMKTTIADVLEVQHKTSVLADRTLEIIDMVQDQVLTTKLAAE